MSHQALCLDAFTCCCEDEKEKRGRKRGQTATTKEEDAFILKKFKKLRPPGHYVDSKIVHKSLPCKLKNKICKKTVMRRLNAKGYVMTEKRDKDDPDEKVKKKRITFCRKHEKKTAQHWKSSLQAVADLSEAWLA